MCKRWTNFVFFSLFLLLVVGKGEKKVFPFPTKKNPKKCNYVEKELVSRSVIPFFTFSWNNDTSKYCSKKTSDKFLSHESEWRVRELHKSYFSITMEKKNKILDQPKTYSLFTNFISRLRKLNESKIKNMKITIEEILSPAICKV